MTKHLFALKVAAAIFLTVAAAALVGYLIYQVWTAFTAIVYMFVLFTVLVAGAA